MAEAKISVIVPIYNVESRLARCIESIQRQTYQNLEIILVDDGSEDACGTICDHYAKQDSRIHVIHKSNGGLSDARNAGLDYATGSYIGFVDGDDWVCCNMYATLYSVSLQYSADIVECSYRNVFAHRVKEETACRGEITEADATFALGSMFDWKYFKPVVFNKLYRAHTIGDLRFPVGRIHEDEFLTYRFFYNAQKLVYLDVALCNYDRTRDDSITNKQFSEQNLDACWAFRERIDFFREHNLTGLEEKANNAYCWQVLTSLYKCYSMHIQGQKVDALLAQAISDIAYLEQHLVDPQYLADFKLLQKGIKAYGKSCDARATC